MVALRALAEERVDIELLAPDRDFFYRPLAVAEPFGAGVSLRFDIRALATGCGARHRLGSLAAVSAGEHRATTAQGEPFAYDALLLATGARQYIAVPGALTYREPGLPCVLEYPRRGAHRRRQDSRLRRPEPRGWPLPLYELALQTATGWRTSRVVVEIRLLTPREAPLSVFGHRGQRSSPSSSPTRASSS